jgi:hypothetical protein
VKPLSNPAHSVHVRLLKLAEQTGQNFNELLVRYFLERLLYRLSTSRHRDGFVLKGAMLFILWKGTLHRRTRDMDLLGLGNPTLAEVTQIFREICSQPGGTLDGMSFDPETVLAEEIRSRETNVGIRVTLRAHLGNARQDLQIDIGFGDSLIPPPAELEYPSLLDFPRPLLLSYAPETALAEKYRALVTYGLLNTRMKDYHDFWEIGHSFAFSGQALAAAIQATFACNATPLPAILPPGLTEEFWGDRRAVQWWNAFWKKAVNTDPIRPFEEVVRFSSAFLWPPATAAARGEAFNAEWPAGGPWTSA